MGYIKKIRIQNFKSLEDVELDISSLNFLFGPNSSGKSSFIKALLFLYNNLFPLNNKDLIYEIDKNTDLISYKDIVTNNEIDRKISYEFDFQGKYEFNKKPFEKCEYGWSAFVDKEYNINDQIKDEEELEVEDYMTFNMNINLRFEFASFDKSDFKLASINIKDNNNNLTLSYTINSPHIIANWNYNGEITKKPEFLIFKKCLSHDFLLFDNLHSQLKYFPFSADTINDCDKIDQFKNCNLEVDKENEEFDLLESQEKASQLYYLYYFLVPNILRSSLKGLYLPPIREIPPKKYYLNDKEKFKNNDYYDLLNTLYLHQYSLKYLNDENNLTDSDFIPKYLEIYLNIDKIKFYLKGSLKKNLQKNYPNKHLDNKIEYYLEKYLNHLFEFFYLGTGNKEIDSLNSLEEYYRYNDDLFDKENKSIFILDVLKEIPKKYAKYLYHFIRINDKIGSLRDVPEWYGFYPSFNYNLSILINETLKIFGFDNFIYISKSEDAGKILSINQNNTTLYINNESSGFLQLLPILFGLVFIKSRIDSCDSFFKRDKETSGIIIKGFFDKYQGTVDFNVLKYNKFSLFVEQPELHIHPKLQCKFAEYIGELINSFNPFNHLFVETHSEHIIRKIQVLIAQGKLNKEKVGINYLYMDNGKTKVKKMEIEDNGFLSEPWPDGFFDDSYNLSMELLTANKN